MAERATGGKPVPQKERGRGVVRKVPAGDTLVVLQVDKNLNGPPVERTISLSNLSAPRLGLVKGEDREKDEPYAWQSREFLRKKAIGQLVSFIIEFKPPSGNKEYGLVFLNTRPGEPQENLAKHVAAEGWAKVKRPPGEFVRPDVEELINLETEATTEKRGIHSKNEVVRNFVSFEPQDLFPQLKGKPQTGVVEQVRNGHSVRVILQANNKFYDIPLFISGVKCPDTLPNGEYEPYSREAKFFTEHFLLHRDVTIIFEGVDKRNFYGTVSVGGQNIAEELLTNGLAQYVEWSGSRTALTDSLKKAEQSAQKAKLRIWSTWEEPKKLSKQEKGQQAPKLGKEINGVVTEIVNAGTVIITDAKEVGHRVNFSSITLPRGGNVQGRPEKDPEDEIERAWAWEGKEFTRRRLIGQKVRAVLDYTRPPPQQRNAAPNQTNAQEKERAYYSVYVDKNNVAVELVDAGLAKAQNHQGNDQRSRDYEHILLAESRAKKAGKGWHMAKDKAPAYRIVDLSAETEKLRAKQYLPSLQRAGKIRGVVEYEFSASRFKVYIPKESCQIILSLSGIRSPQKNEEFSKESVEFIKKQVHQNDIEFEVIGQDKSGFSFIGNAWIQKQGKKHNIAVLLLDEGYAETLPSVRDSEHQTEYNIAEEAAKNLKKKIWKNYDPEAELEAQRRKEEEERERRQPKAAEFVDITVTHIDDANNFYVQVLGKQNDELQELMKNLSVQDSDEPYTPEQGELVIAKFSGDNAWYRAEVTGVSSNGEFEVFYVDYGNAESVPASRIRPIEEQYTQLKRQAQPARLAFIKSPSLDDDYGAEAAEFFRNLVWDKKLSANIQYRDGSVLHLTMGDEEVLVNAALLRAGLARLERGRNRGAAAIVAKLKEEENKARADHSALWQYGDPGSDEEEDARKRGGKGAPAPAKKEEKKPAEKKGADKKGKEEK